MQLAYSVWAFVILPNSINKEFNLLVDQLIGEFFVNKALFYISECFVKFFFFSTRRCNRLYNVFKIKAVSCLGELSI